MELHKDKLSWPLVVTVLIYIAAGAIALTVLLPSHNEAKDLEARIELLRQEGKVVSDRGRKAALETKILDMQERLLTLEKDIPSQYDLPACRMS